MCKLRFRPSRLALLALFAALAGCGHAEVARTPLEGLILGDSREGSAALQAYVRARRTDARLGQELERAGFAREIHSRDGCTDYRYHKQLDTMGQRRDALVWLCHADVGANVAYTFL
ncbi:MAG TPA: hypothetical protein VGF77_11105 [Allosphingosinicella sp.]|jgi:hypothetical protein